MAISNYSTHTITAAGATITVDVEYPIDVVILAPSSAPLTMAGNIVVNFSGTPSDGQQIIVAWGYFDLNGNTMTINGASVNDLQASLANGQISFGYVDGGWRRNYATSLSLTQALDASILVDETVTLAKLEDLASSQIIVGDGTNRPAAVSVTGDVTISNAGVTAIGAGKITNTMVNSSAAIARTKLASGTADHVLINDGSGVMSSIAQVKTDNGGTGQDTSASTGFATVSAGTWSVGSITEVITCQVSFETGELGDFKITLPYACTVTGIYAYAIKAIAATDNATIVPKNNAGTTMTSGTITFTASDPRGTAYTSTPSASNTFTAGQILTLTTAKTTAGGKVLVSVTVTRTS